MIQAQTIIRRKTGFVTENLLKITTSLLLKSITKVYRHIALVRVILWKQICNEKTNCNTGDDNVDGLMCTSAFNGRDKS